MGASSKAILHRCHCRANVTRDANIQTHAWRVVTAVCARMRAYVMHSSTFASPPATCMNALSRRHTSRAGVRVQCKHNPMTNIHPKRCELKQVGLHDYWRVAEETQAPVAASHTTASKCIPTSTPAMLSLKHSGTRPGILSRCCLSIYLRPVISVSCQRQTSVLPNPS